MRKSIKKCSIFGAISLTLALSATGALLSTNTASANSTVYVENGVAVQGFEMVKGAAVRIDDVTGVSGMRFRVNVSEDFKNYLSTTYEDASFTYGSLVDYKGRAVEELSLNALDEFMKVADHTTTDVQIDANEPEFNRIIKYFETEQTPTPAQMQAALDLALSARYYVKVDSADDTKDCVIYAKANDNTRTARAVINAHGIENGTANLRTDITKVGTGVTDVDGDFEINVTDEDYEAITVDGLADGTYTVYYDAKNMGEVTAVDGVVTLPFGAQDKTVANYNVFTLRNGDNAMQNYKVNVVDKVIKTADEFKSLLSTATTQHYVLGNDIEKVEGYPYAAGKFSGTLDGRGYSVNEITYAKHPSYYTGGWLFYQFAGTVKNISFDKMTVQGNSNYDNRQSGIAFGVVGRATLDNVFINATTSTTTQANAMFGDAWGDDYGITMKDVVVIMNGTENNGTLYAIMGSAGKSVNATNVYVSGVKADGSAVSMSPDGDIAGCDYKTEAELLAMANNNEFATEMLNEKVLANVEYVVDKTATQNYYVENWSTDNVITVTNDHTPKFIANEDLSDLGSTTIQKITANDVDLGYNAETGELDASKLTKGTNATWNIYYSNNEVYKVTVNVVDAVIKDATDFKEILSNAKTEHIVLGNDIEKVENYPWAQKTFSGTLDGRGYSIGEITYARHPSYYTGGWLFYYLKGTIKNISFNKMTVLGNSVADNRQSGIARAVTGYATLENVFINATTTTTSQANAMFDDAWGDYSITIKNVVVIMNGTGVGGTPYAIIGANKTVNATNVYVSGVLADGSQVPMAPSGDITGCTYKTETELLEMANAGDTTLTTMAQTAIQKALGTN